MQKKKQLRSSLSGNSDYRTHGGRMVRDGHLQALCMEAIAKRFPTGAAFSLMDLSVEAEAFGSPVSYSEDEVPTVTAALVHDEEEAEALKVPEVGAGRTGECVKGIKEVTGLITDRPVLAGIIGPFSLAGRLLDMTEIMILCYEEPEMVETVLEKVTGFLCDYARAFKEAGATALSWQNRQPDFSLRGFSESSLCRM